MKLYLVIGHTGEYSDRQQWVVCAYLDENKAKHHAEKAGEYARIEFEKLESKYRGDLIPENPWDAKMMIDYTGTSYKLETTELIDY